MKHIKILGCGWLGLPLASHFFSKGYQVHGSTTSKEKFRTLEEKGIKPYLINLPEQINPSFFEPDGVVIIDIPPQTRSKGKDFQKQCIESILPYISSEDQVIYISATSVYPPIDDKIDEKINVDGSSERAIALWQTEDLLKEHLGDRLCVLRMGGLLGYDRIPGKYSAGKEVDTGNEKVNYIHRDDAINIISKLVEDGLYPETFNVVAPEHPQKKKVYSKNSEDLNFEKALFVENKDQLSKKFISNEKLERFLDYTFLYPDPLNFYYTKS